MHYRNVCLESFGYELPEQVVTSDELEQRLAPVYDKLRLPFGRLELMSGIRERRFWDEGTLPSTVSAKAAEKAIEKAGIARESLQCLIHASVSRDCLEPATATMVHKALSLPSQAIAFDVSNACLGFMNGLMLLANMIELNQVQSGIIVCGEHAGPLVETTIGQILNDPVPTREKLKYAFASLTIGSGAAAVILTHAGHSKTGHRLAGGMWRTDSRYNHLCRGGTSCGNQTADWGDQTITMATASEMLLQEGCRLAHETWLDTKRQLGWGNADVDRFFCHQVGTAHRRTLYNLLEIDLRKDYSTFDYLGNMGSASLPVTMAIGANEGILKAGHKVGMLGIGSGIVCAMLGVTW
jgi:3-oxoacyl-[acyl-carrier-protein] synthase III